MKAISAWSRRGIIRLWAWWLGGIAAVMLMMLVVAYWQVRGDVKKQQATVAERLGYLPPEAADVRVSVDSAALAWDLAFALGPPGIATLLWGFMRNRHRNRPT